MNCDGEPGLPVDHSRNDRTFYNKLDRLMVCATAVEYCS